MGLFCCLCFMFGIFLSFPCSFVVTCSEKAGLLAFVCYFFVVSCHFPILYLTVSIPVICLLPYFESVPSRG